jgi:hypothetical protein
MRALPLDEARREWMKPQRSTAKINQKIFIIPD